MTPQKHFFGLYKMVPELRGLAILDSDSTLRQDTDEDNLTIRYWSRYEIENYFITPAVLREYTLEEYADMPTVAEPIDAVLDELILKKIFSNNASNFETWNGLDDGGRRLLWETGTKGIKLSDFGESFFRTLAERLDLPMLLRKGDLYRLVDFVDPTSISDEVGETLDLIQTLFDGGES